MKLAVVFYLTGLAMLVIVYEPHWGTDRTIAVAGCFLGKLVLLVRVHTSERRTTCVSSLDSSLG